VKTRHCKLVNTFSCITPFFGDKLYRLIGDMPGYIRGENPCSSEEVGMDSALFSLPLTDLSIIRHLIMHVIVYDESLVYKIHSRITNEKE
jgi:hypothetical protein